MENIKIGLISDCHLGYKAGKKVNEQQINIRQNDGYEAFRECIDGFIKNKVDVVVVAGDLFHSPKPDVITVIKTKEQLERLAKESIPCYIITGNHDVSDISYDPSSVLMVNSEITGIHAMSDAIKTVLFKDKIKFWFVSHQSTEEQKNTFKQINLEDEYVNILVTHGSCYDDHIGMLLHTELEPREIIIPERILKLNWDYTLMGHIHERGWVHSKDKKTDTSKRKQFYGGSLIRRGFADKECKLGRGFTILNVNPETKNIELEMFNIKQRSQVEVTVDAEPLSGKEISDYIFNKIKEIDDSEQPIVRVVVYSITKNKKSLIDWASIKELTDNFLTFSVVYKEESLEKTLENITYNTESNDILSDYGRFWSSQKDNFEDNLREKVKETSEEFIKRGVKDVAK